MCAKGYPAQHQDKQPGEESIMSPTPKSAAKAYRAAGKLEGRVALISGGDSGIGRSVAVAFAKEGADIGFVYLDEHHDAEETRRLVESQGRRCMALAGDICQKEFCRQAVERTANELGRLNILVNNAAVQFPQEDLEGISAEQLEKTFRTNIMSYFFMSKASLPRLEKGGCIVNSTSVTAYRGSKHLLDYSATKGAIVSFTRSLALNLVNRGIRVNAVAPGPVWTPLIPASFPRSKVEDFGKQVPMERAAEPDEISPCYVFLASDDSSFMTGQVLHPNGGEMVGG